MTPWRGLWGFMWRLAGAIIPVYTTHIFGTAPGGTPHVFGTAPDTGTKRIFETPAEATGTTRVFKT